MTVSFSFYQHSHCSGFTASREKNIICIAETFCMIEGEKERRERELRKLFFFYTYLKLEFDPSTNSCESLGFVVFLRSEGLFQDSTCCCPLGKQPVSLPWIIQIDGGYCVHLLISFGPLLTLYTVSLRQEFTQKNKVLSEKDRGNLLKEACQLSRT